MCVRVLLMRCYILFFRPERKANQTLVSKVLIGVKLRMRWCLLRIPFAFQVKCYLFVQYAHAHTHMHIESRTLHSVSVGFSYFCYSMINKCCWNVLFLDRWVSTPVHLHESLDREEKRWNFSTWFKCFGNQISMRMIQWQSNQIETESTLNKSKWILLQS